MVFDFLEPISENFISYIENLPSQALGKNVLFNTNDSFPDLDEVSLVIICVNEYSGAALENEYRDFNVFRKKLYALFPGNWNVTIADLGNIQFGETIEDTFFLIKSINEDLLRKKIIPIIIGGSHDVTYPLYRAYDNLDQMVNLVTIDSQFDFARENATFEKSFLTKIIVEEPNNLFNFSNIGYQTYYNSQEEIDLIEKLYFDAYRLGEVSHKIAIAEPVFRDADMVTIDMNAVQSSYSGDFANFNPNGFEGKEICALGRYSGISDKVSTFGVFNSFFSEKESTLIAQIIWYFIEGYCFRSKEYPFGTKERYLKYIVLVEEEELIFFKSNKTDRWWIEIPFLDNKNNKLKRNTLLPCTHDDYLAACEQEIPSRWWKAYRRNLL
ncbi:formimidoylglutamase [Flavobacterium sp. J27]|uniref:formimidoylglutamase n=1 Tax=Flavobacterium sp. J27 TaxID=2060419 RepID=UPI00102F549F|nr:formimidoylglutamase [Flavobacterium sp. J27]